MRLLRDRGEALLVPTLPIGLITDMNLLCIRFAMDKGISSKKGQILKIVCKCDY